MDKKKLIFMVLFLAIAFIPLVSAECYVWLIGDSCDLNRVFWDSTDYGGLNTRTKELWAEVITRNPADDATTECSEVITEGTHHTMYCDKVAGSDTELSFKSFFKSRIKNYKITEMKTIEHRDLVNVAVDYKEVVCPKEYEKNITCHDYVWEQQEKVWYENVEIPLSTKAVTNDWELLNKRDFIKDEKRTYKVEWDDIAPSLVKQVLQGSLRQGFAVFPMVYSYINEISINPLIKYNSTDANWGGVASNTELDVSNNITATETVGADVLTPIDWGYTGAVAETFSMTERIWNHTLTQPLTFKEGVVLELAGGERSIGEEMAGNISMRIGVGATASDGVGNLSKLHAVGCYAEWDENVAGAGIYVCNLTHWRFEAGVSEITFGTGWTIWFYANNTIGADTNSFGRRTTTDANPQSSYWYPSWTQQAVDVWFNLYSLTAGATTYAPSGNRTLDGLCPDYPRLYEWNNGGVVQVDNDANNYAGMTVKFSNDNATWGNEKAYGDLNDELYACALLIPNVTTDTTTTPRISEVSIEYTSVTPPEIYIDVPQNTTYYTFEVDLNITVIDPDGISWVGYSLDEGLTNTTISPYTSNATLSGLSSGANTVWVYANDTDNQRNQTYVDFNRYFIPDDITPSINSSDVTLNRTDADIYCIFTPTTTGSDTILTANLTWWIDDINNQSFSGISVTNGTQYVRTLDHTGTHKNDVIKCEVSIGDSLGYFSSPINSSTIAIENTPPTIPPTLAPVSAYRTENNTQILTCAGSTDADNDEIFYSIFGDTANPPTTLLQNTTSTTYSWNFPSGVGNYTWRCLADDKQGISSFITPRSIYANWNNLENNATEYQSPVLGGQTTTLYLNTTFNTLTVSNLTGQLHYNNTMYGVSETLLNSTLERWSSTVVVPVITNSTAGVSFYWNWSILHHNGTVQEWISPIYRQTIQEIELQQCMGVNNATQWTTLNFTAYEENSTPLAKMNVTMDFWFTWWKDNTQYNYTLTQINNSIEDVMFCLSPAWASTQIEGIVEYSKTGYETEHYYFHNASLSNSTQNIGLFFISTGESSNIQVTVQDSDYEGLADHYVTALRLDVATGTYHEVEIGKTDDDGQTILQLRLYDTIYKFLVKDEHYKVVFESSDMKIQSTSLEFTLDEDFTFPSWNFVSGSTFAYSLTYNNNTQLVIYTYTDAGNTITSGGLVVQQLSFTNETSTICNSTVAGSTGSITCNITDIGGSGNFIANAFANNRLIQIATFSISEAWKIFGKSGVFWGVGLIVTLALIGIWNPVVSVGLAMLGVVVVSAIGLMPIVPSALIGILCIGVVLWINLKT